MSEQQYMQLALELAAKAEGRTCPNPPVGAVVVLDGEVVGQGFHPEAGQPHAEIFALREAGDKAAGAALFVTLEPCNHTGRTGPCTEAIIAAGVKTVIIGTLDPNPLVAGKGVERLQSEGINVSVGVHKEACCRLIAPFAKHVSSKLPYITLKMAMTLDGQTATSTGDSRWISNEQSRHFVHQMRDKTDAIMVGIGTVLADDPQLTTRLPGGVGKDPIRVIVDSKLRIPDNAQVLSVDSPASVIIVTTDAADPVKMDKLKTRGVEFIIVGENDGKVDLLEMVKELGQRDMQSILLEGGAILAAQALRYKIADRAAVFIAPKFLGGDDGSGVFSGVGCTKMNNAVQLKDINVRHFGDDILVEGEII